MKASTKRILSILTAILMIIASIFVYSSLINPSYSEIKNLRSEVAGRLELVAQHKTSIDQVKKILGEYQGAVQIQDMVSTILPPEQNLSSAVHQINKLASVNELPIELLSAKQLAIKPSNQPELVKGVGTLRFNLRVVGSYEKFKSFLQNLETNINLMDLASLKIEPQTKGAGNNFNYTMVVDTYYQSD
jgi:Tfp pilus assembly protein PilO